MAIDGHIQIIILLPSLKATVFWSFRCNSVVKNLTSIHEYGGSIPVLVQWVKGPLVLL